MTPASFEEVRGVAADVLGLAPERITPESSPQEIESWDSVQHLNLILAVEERFAFQFEPEEIEQMKTVGQIAAIVERKLGQTE